MGVAKGIPLLGETWQCYAQAILLPRNITALGLTGLRPLSKDTLNRPGQFFQGSLPQDENEASGDSSGFSWDMASALFHSPGNLTQLLASLKSHIL